jgi:hypothetical protein
MRYNGISRLVYLLLMAKLIYLNTSLTNLGSANGLLK